MPTPNSYPWSWLVIIAAHWYPDIAYQNEPMVYRGRSSTYKKAYDLITKLTEEYPPLKVNIRWEPYSKEE